MKEALKLALDLAIMHHTDEGYADLRSKVRQLAKEALAPTSTPCEVQDEPSQYGSPEMQALILAKLQPVEGLFINLIAQHEGLAEEMAQDELCSSQEPVAFISPGGHIHYDPYLDSVPLYTTPSKRPWGKPWVSLTDEEIETCRERAFSTNNPYCPVDKKSMWKAYQYLEAKLKEKNT